MSVFPDRPLKYISNQVLEWNGVNIYQRKLSLARHRITSLVAMERAESAEAVIFTNTSAISVVNGTWA
jgi:hypothetical protein